MLCFGTFRVSLGLFHFESSFSILILLLNISLYLTNIFIMQTDVISLDYNLKALKDYYLFLFHVRLHFYCYIYFCAFKMIQ